jgi:acyl-CoA hydrolase
MCGEPRDILKAITDYLKENNIKGVEHHSLLTFHDHDFLKPEMKDNIKHISWFTSGYSRSAVREGRADYMPTFYKNVPKIWEEQLDVDVFYALVSPMDDHGYFSFGLACSESLVVKNKAKKIFLEVNPNMPRTHGQNFIHISEVDSICESSYDIPVLSAPTLSDFDMKIGSIIANEIPNGATIQLGIGGIPNAVGRALMGKKDLGIHSEMFVDAFVDLIESGAATNRNKEINKGKSVTTFAGGSKRLYDFLNDNPSIEFKPVDYVNDPQIIAKHENFMSINSCVEVDLLGQVCSESMGREHYSGTGGQVDFVRGANLSSGGKSFIAMYSTAKRGTMSKIKPVLTHGSVVTTSKNEVDYIATENGLVRLKGKTASQRAKALIGIAHPDFRDELVYEAKKLNLIV